MLPGSVGQRLKITRMGQAPKDQANALQCAGPLVAMHHRYSCWCNLYMALVSTGITQGRLIKDKYRHYSQA